MKLYKVFLDTLIAELDHDDVVGIVLGGSYARGDATRYSDVDIACFTKDAQKQQKKQFFYRDERLVSIATKNETAIRADMLKPNAAIWVVPGLSDCRILLDKDGSVRRLLNDIRAFKWEPLQQAADEYSSFGMMASAELVHKILNERFKKNDLAISYATSKLLSGLTEVMAVQRGILVKSDNTYYRQVQESVGLDSDWTQYHQMLIGVDEGSTKMVRYADRGIAALYLFKETLSLVRPFMGVDHLAVASEAVRQIDEVASICDFSGASSLCWVTQSNHSDNHSD